ncbi:MAG: DUF2937 family protein, partial [Pseudomonadales bacterium]|nr:DUF2937 family protein [Pseudomonadales bacterium]
MVLSLIRTSARLFFFGGGLLLGIQVPAFVDQYSQRVDAHYREVSINVSGFQSTADDLFAGDLQALVEYYRESNDLVFNRDSDSLQLIVDRYYRIQAEQEALQANFVAAALHVIFAADRELFAEAREQYSYTVPLNGLALQWGLAAAVILFLLAELTTTCCAGCV